MKKVRSFLKRCLPHLTLILSCMMIIFFTIDQFNESMAFLNNAITKNLLLVFSLLTLCLSVLSILQDENKR